MSRTVFPAVRNLQMTATSPTKVLPVFSSVIDHSCTVKAENGYENLNFEAIMTEMHGC